MKFKNTLCPYSQVALKRCANVNQEHILGSALGGPDGLVIRCEEAHNQRLNVELDVPAMRMEMLQLLAVASGVVSRSGKDNVTLAGSLPNGDPAKETLSPNGARFTATKPVDIDPTTGLVRGVTGFGNEAQHRAEEVIARYRSKGLHLQASEPQTLPSVVKVSATLDGNLLLRLMCRTAYLMTVATLGDVAIISDSGEQYLRAINTKGMTRDTLTDNFIGAIQAEPSQHPLTFENPYAGGHTLACLATHDSLLSHVVLFGVFYATFITRNPSGYGGDSRVFFINPASRDYKASDFVKEANAGRITSLVKPTSLSN